MIHPSRRRPQDGGLGCIVGPAGDNRHFHERGITLHLTPWLSNFVGVPDDPAAFHLAYDTRGRFGTSIQELPSPLGMSGSGMWFIERSKPESIWLPEPLLTGIFVEHVQNGAINVMRGLPIAGWLRLVHREYDELRAVIDAWLADEKP